MSDPTLMQAWAKFCRELSLSAPTIEAGSQLIYRNRTWEFPARILMNDTDMTLPKIGFTQNKMRQLIHHYFNPETIARAKADLDDRVDGKKYGSGRWDFDGNKGDFPPADPMDAELDEHYDTDEPGTIFNFRGQEKKTTKQDFCIMDGVICYYPPLKRTDVFINFRTAELIFRHRADLLFLRDFILPKFELERALPEVINLRYVNCTFHPMFAIFLLIELEDWDDYLDEMQQNWPRLFRQVIRWTNIHLAGRYQAYMTAARVQKHVNLIASKGKIAKLRSYCKEFDKE